MTDIAWAETPADRLGFVRRAVAHGFGLGCVCGGIEMVAIAARIQLVLSFDEGLVLGAVSVLGGGLLGSLIGGLFGGLLSIRNAVPERWVPGLSFSTGLTAGALSAWHLWPAGWVVATQREQPLGALAFALAPLGFAGLVNLHARYGLRRAQRGQPFKLGWISISLLASLALILVGSFSIGGRSFGTARAVESDPSVVLITVDTLRRDHLSLYGNSPVQTPVLDELAAEGIVFDNAVTPLPETAPAHAAMLTGRHPVRLGMLSNGHQIKRGVRTLAQSYGEEGFATAAFVSSFAVDSRTGLSHGFEAYDDDFFPHVRGLAEIRLAEWGIRAVMRLGDPMMIRSLLERPGEDTCSRAVRWVRGLGPQPYFLWVHLFEPHSPYEPHGLAGFEHNGTPGEPAVDHSWVLANEQGFDYTVAVQGQLRDLYAEEVAYTDQVLGEFLDRIRSIDDRELTIVVASDHGEMLGEHEIMFNHHGIWDDVIRVPLIVVLPESKHAGLRVAGQVRLMDVANTMLASTRMKQFEDTESVNLLRHAEGTLDRDLGTLLMGRVTASLSEGTLYGYRASLGGRAQTGQNLKYIWRPDTADEDLFDLSVDPGELDDMSQRQAEALQRLREQVEVEVGDRLQTEPAARLSPGDREALRSLGYVE